LTLKITCESGYSACDRPKSIEMDGEQHEICEITSEWREPGAKHFLVKIQGELQFQLTFFEATGEWKYLEIFDTK
jgi:hypothetical protein